MSLQRSERPLREAYDLAMLDLDGVVYVGSRAVDGAPHHVAGARAAGMQVAFITNNALRTPAAVARHLTELGVAAAPTDVVTSAQAAAQLIRERLGARARVTLLGGQGLDAAVRDAGLVPVELADEAAVVVTGYGPEVVWRDLMRAAVMIRDGLWWVACNADMTIPTDFGIAPGHGVQVGMISRFAGVDPDVAGKPSYPLFAETLRRVPGERPLMVGDRLDTDIAGGNDAGMDTLLVLTGVTGLAELTAAPAGQRPTFLSPDLSGLEQVHPPVLLTDGVASCKGWAARIAGGSLSVEGSGCVADWWRAVAVASWAWTDRTGTHVATDGVQPPR